MGFSYISVAILLLTVSIVNSSYNVDSFLEDPPQYFETDKAWSFINFTWPSYDIYADAIDTQKYIPGNNVMAGIKMYGNRLYIALPRVRPGSPVTLAYVEMDGPTYNQLLRPFPSWEMNAQEDCSTIQNIQSMEIDTNGIMWILDGIRSQLTTCPPKLVLLDLNNDGNVVHTYIVPPYISQSIGGTMNDIVIDESDGGFAYITDSGAVDPGLIVYSREKDRAWKIRDVSMYAEPGTEGFIVDGIRQNGLVPIDGIALSPIDDDERYVYYCALTGNSLFAINTSILKNEALCQTYSWRSSVIYVGDKGQSGGLAIDSEGNLFYGLLSQYSVGEWNIHQPFSTSEVISQDEKTFIWTDSFCFDNLGSLYLLNNGINKFFDPSYPLKVGYDIKFRIVKWYTASLSYLYHS